VPLYKGASAIAAVYKGSDPISRIYKGTTLVFEAGGGGPAPSPLLGITKLRKTAQQSISAGVDPIVWEAVDYDNLNAFHLGTSTSNIIVPAGVGLARVMLKPSWQTEYNGTRFLEMLHGSDVLFAEDRASLDYATNTEMGPWFPVTPGTTMYMAAAAGGTKTFSPTPVNSGGVSGLVGYAEMAIEWASDWATAHVNIEGITAVKRTTNQGFAGLGPITYTTEDYDNLNAFSGGVLTVPTGVNWVRASAFGQWVADDGPMVYFTLSDGVGSIMADFRISRSTSRHSISSGWIATAPGRTITASFSNSSGARNLSQHRLVLEWATGLDQVHS
jgi:hypothetical protein